jgi:hypothetical protein
MGKKKPHDWGFDRMAVCLFNEYKVHDGDWHCSGAGMKTSTQARTGLFGLLTILVLSSATMLWMFWHYPVATGIATLIILSALGISARLARWIDTDGLSDFKRTKA